MIESRFIRIHVQKPLVEQIRCKPAAGVNPEQAHQYPRHQQPIRRNTRSPLHRIHPAKLFLKLLQNFMAHLLHFPQRVDVLHKLLQIHQIRHVHLWFRSASHASITSYFAAYVRPNFFNRLLVLAGFQTLSDLLNQTLKPKHPLSENHEVPIVQKTCLSLHSLERHRFVMCV